MIDYIEHGKYRAVIDYDEWAEEPYDDGMSPILRFISGSWGQTVFAGQVGGTSYEVPSDIIDVARRCYERDGIDNGMRTFKRYLKAFHGGTALEWQWVGDSLFVTFDTAHWREAMGIDDALLASRDDLALADMSEYVAYLNGECYIIYIEKQCDCCESWETDESTPSRGGFYDYDYAWEEAETLVKDMSR